MLKISPLLIASMIATGVNALVGIFLGRQFDAQEYGELLFFIAVFSNLRFITSAGIGLKTITDTASAERDDTEALSRIFYSHLLIRVLSGCVVLMVAIAYGSWRSDSVFVAAGLLASITTILDFYHSFIQGLKKIIATALVVICQPALFAVFILWWGHEGLAAAILAFALSFLFTLISLLTALWPSRVGISWPSRRHLSSRYVLESLREMSLLFGLGSLQQLTVTAPVLFLGGQAEFAVGAHIGVVLNLVLMFGNVTHLALSGWLVPTVSESFSGGNTGEARGQLASYSWYMLLVGCWLGAATAAWPDLILQVLYADRYLEAIQLLTLAAVLIPLATYQRTLNLGLVATQNIRSALVGRAIQAVIIVIGSLILTNAGIALRSVLPAIVLLVVVGTIGSTIYQERVLTRSIGLRSQLAGGFAALAIGAVSCAGFRMLVVGGVRASFKTAMPEFYVVALAATTTIPAGIAVIAFARVFQSDRFVDSDGLVM